MAGRFDYPQAREISGVLRRNGVKFLFIGKSGAIILGYPDTTQDADLFVKKDPANGRALVESLVALGFPLDAKVRDEIVRGKDFVQLREGPFDLDLVFAPDGIETFEKAESRSLLIEEMPVCHPDDIIRSKEAAGRQKDLEGLPRLKAFRDWWKTRHGSG